jgi:Zn-dependent protease with chaperone function
MKAPTTVSLRANTVVALILSSALVAGQTQITPPANSYPLSQDVELGRQAAAEARKELPLMRDDAVTSYVDDIGRRLVAAIRPDLQHPEFQYTFEVVNVREINAFALPGGPMFVNRGMIEAAKTEGEVAGVMAHEISHVTLRHGTAQASKAQKYQVGQVAGAILGAIVGGAWGQVISQGSQFGLGTAFLRFSREFEQQADIEGAHTMARAGYDPMDMANMFKTIEKTSDGSGGPQWLSDHPNPGNRSEYILKEAKALRVDNPIRDARRFEQVQAHLKSLPPAPTTEQATKATKRRGGTSEGETRAPSGRVEPPAGSYRTYNEGNLFRVTVPANWRELQDTNTVTFAPDGAHGSFNGESVFTHGIEFGIARNESHDLQAATEELILSLAQGNPSLRQSTGYDRINVADRRGLRTILTNRNEATRQDEMIEVFTTQLRNGNLLYVIGVAPRDEFPSYRNVFERVIASLQVSG